MKKEFILSEEDSIKLIPCLPGIYCLINNVNNKRYVGLAINLRKRILSHRITARSTKFRNLYLYRSIDKYGIINFSIKIIEIIDIDNIENIKSILDKQEKYYIQKYNTYGENGYNMTLGGDAGVLGYKHTEETKKHLTEVAKKNVTNRRTKYAYNIETKELVEAESTDALCKLLTSITEHNVSSSLICNKIKTHKLYLEKWHIAYSKEDALNESTIVRTLYKGNKVGAPSKVSKEDFLRIFYELTKEYSGSKLIAKMSETIQLSYSQTIKNLKKYEISGFGIKRIQNRHVWTEEEIKEKIIEALRMNKNHYKYKLRQLGMSSSSVDRWTAKYKDFIEELLKELKR